MTHRKDRVENLCLNLVVEKEDMEEHRTGLSESEMEEATEVLEDGRTSEEVNERSFFILNDAATGAPCQVEVEVVRDEADLMEIPISTSESVCTEVSS